MLGDAKLYYYKARVYDPAMGRFLQADPIGTKDDLDFYAYLGGDPVNKSDPTGLWESVHSNGKTDSQIRADNEARKRRNEKRNSKTNVPVSDIASSPGEIAKGYAEKMFGISNKGVKTIGKTDLAISVTSTASFQANGYKNDVASGMNEKQAAYGAAARTGVQVSGALGGAAAAAPAGSPLGPIGVAAAAIIGGISGQYFTDKSGLTDDVGEVVEKSVSRN